MKIYKGRNLTKKERLELLRIFEIKQYLSMPEVYKIAEKMNIDCGKIIQWFKNKRFRTKKYIAEINGLENRNLQSSLIFKL